PASYPTLPLGVTYRVPALLYIPSDTLLAFAEKRSSARDEDAEYLVLRRGRKTGTSAAQHLWGPREPLTSAVLLGYRTMSPCLVYERKSQTVFLFFICVRQHVSEQWQIWTGQNAARLCYVWSGDAGQTWSSLTDLTEQVIGEDLKDWATFAVGPGHGVQLRSGRLVIPAYAYHITARCCHLPLPWGTQPRSLVFYSDDGGQRWHKGELIEGMKTGECQVAEVACQACDPVLYCNARTPCRCRAAAFSTDQGLTFESPSSCKKLCEPPHGCQGSVMDGAEEPDAPAHQTTCLTVSWLLYSHPMDKCKRPRGVELGAGGRSDGDSCNGRWGGRSDGAGGSWQWGAGGQVGCSGRGIRCKGGGGSSDGGGGFGAMGDGGRSDGVGGIPGCTSGR
uniref:exo-alpha-sialidase n=1 Tax=Chelonoidis abingdonii TaxID=106734 RepID=A0A8C0INB5_CHEAB